MPIYTLTSNLIHNVTPSDTNLFGSLFYVFINEKSGYKLAIDNNKHLLNFYAQVQIKDDKIKHHYFEWLSLLSETIDKVCEFVNVQIDENDKDGAFLDVASSINGNRKMIVYSRNANCPYECDENNAVEHNGKKISVLDKDEATIEINQKNEVNITTYGDNSPAVVGDNNKLKIKLI